MTPPPQPPRPSPGPTPDGNPLHARGKGAPRVTLDGARADPLAWLFLVVGLSLVHRYRFLFDDAFIYFRYVDNFVHLGAGPVYNAGEYVEGYSSPAQLLVLSLLRAAGLSFPAAVWGLGYGAFVLFWALCLRIDRAWTPAGTTPLHLPLALLCANYGVTTFFTSGLETPLVHVTAAGYALSVAQPRSRLARALVFASPLVRPELAVPLGLYVLHRALWGGEALRRLLPAPLLINGAWLGFRIIYYAEAFPNTFYLKDDVEVATGLGYLWDLERAYHGSLWLLAGAAIALGLRRSVHARQLVQLGRRSLLLLMAAAVAAYIVKVGGAPMHYWYLAFPFTLSTLALSGLAESALAAWGPAKTAAANRLGRPLALALCAVSFVLMPAQLQGHPAFGTPEHRERDLILDAAFHRDSPRYDPNRLPALSAAALGRARTAEVTTRGYARWRTENWCRSAYLALDEGVIHSLGLTDKVLAHVDAPDLRQGHKVALVPMARDLLAIRRSQPLSPGMHARAVATTGKPRWIASQRPAIEAIEAHIFNRHRPLENLRLVLRRRPRITAVAIGNGPRQGTGTGL